MTQDKTIIVSRRCDVPMARSKNLLPCGKQCSTCVACIERDQYGNEGHAVHGRVLDYVLLARNLRLRGYYGDLEY